MAVLSAKYTISPSVPLLIEIKEGESLAFEYSYREYEIQLKLPPLANGDKSGHVESDYWKQFSDPVIIIVSKEVGDTPDIPINDNGGRDLYKLSDYFEEHKKYFGEVAETSYRRLIKYFKYRLNQPFLDEHYLIDQELKNPVWVSDTGVDYGCIRPTGIATSYPGLHRDCMGIKTLRKNGLKQVSEFVLNHDGKDELELHREILSDAQTVILCGELRRSVVDLAVTIEIAVKRAYFSGASESARAFEYLEDKGDIKTKLPEYIHKVAEAVFGESFKSDERKKHYDNVLKVISCRNKAAHKGTLKFNYDNETGITPDQEMIEEWYESVVILLDWLESMVGN